MGERWRDFSRCKYDTTAVQEELHVLCSYLNHFCMPAIYRKYARYTIVVLEFKKQRKCINEEEVLVFLAKNRKNEPYCLEMLNS